MWVREGKQHLAISGLQKVFDTDTESSHYECHSHLGWRRVCRGPMS